MSVYLTDGLVLLDGGSIATSEDCCCSSCPCSSVDISCTVTAIITDENYGPGCVILSFSDSITYSFDTSLNCNQGPVQICNCCIDSNTEICSCGTLPGRFGEACYDFTVSGTLFSVGAELAASFCADTCPSPCPFDADYFISCSGSHTMNPGVNNFTDHCEIINGGSFGTINGTIDISTTVTCNP